MSDILQRLQQRRAGSAESPRVLAMTDEETDDVLNALASDNGRSALRVLFEDPSTPSEIATRLDTSVQNVHYHVSNLREAGLVEQVDTVYSEKGNEMTVYGPTSDPLVLVGDERRKPRVERSLMGVVGGLALLGVASLFVQWGAKRLLYGGGTGPTGVGPASWTPAASRPAETVGWLVFEVVEPGAVFFVACLVVATAVLAAGEWR